MSHAAPWNNSGSPRVIKPPSSWGSSVSCESNRPRKRAGTEMMNPATGPAMPMSNNMGLVGIRCRIRITAPKVPVRKGAGRK